MFVDKAERKEHVKVLKQILDVLNRINTSVVFQDDKYIISQNGDKKYEVTVTPSNTLVRAFDNGVPGRFRVIEKEGFNVKAKLWSLQFELESATSENISDKIVEKVKSFASDVDYINNWLTILVQPDTCAEVVNETAVTKIYKLTWTYKGVPGRSAHVEFDGTEVRFDFDNKKMLAEGYMAWKLSVLRRDLDKCVAKTSKAKVGSLKNAIRKGYQNQYQ